MTSSRRITFASGFKRLLLTVALLNSLIGITEITKSLFAPEVYKKDFIQEYLMAKAILMGVDPYRSLPELVAHWLTEATTYNQLKHPTPHTPIVGVLSVPLGLLRYEAASAVWLVLEVACLLATITLLLRWWEKPVSARSVILLFLLVLGWMPIQESLGLGQLNTCLMLLLTNAWLALREGKDVRGGVFLGGVLALKLMAWPIVFFLILQRRWRSVIAVGVMIVAANFFAIIILGTNSMKDYYLKVGPFIASVHRSQDCNISMWSVGQRLFGGEGYYFSTTPFWSSPALASFCTYFVPFLGLWLGLRLALKATEFDTAFGLLTGISILVSPIAWTHYLLLAVIPMMIIARRLWEKKRTRTLFYLALCCGLPLSIAGGLYQHASRFIANLTTAEKVPFIFSARFLPFIPAIALIGLLWALWRLTHDEEPSSSLATIEQG